MIKILKPPILNVFIVKKCDEKFDDLIILVVVNYVENH